MCRTANLSVCSGTGLWDPRRGGTPGEALAGTGDTRQGWINGTGCSP